MIDLIYIYVQVRAHSVMDGNGGYSQISVSGEPHSTVAFSSKSPSYGWLRGKHRYIG